MLNRLKQAGAIACAAAIIVAVVAVAPAKAQTSPNLTKGQVLTAGQWNALFASKQDTLGFVPASTAGATMTGRLVTAASGPSLSGFNITPGGVPASPANGDMWMTSTGLFVRVNGVTVGPLSGGSGGSFAATAPITVTFPGGVVTYACATCAVTNATNTFTAAQVFSVSVQTPLIIGGTAAGSTLALQSTNNGTPSGDIVNITGSSIVAKAFTGNSSFTIGVPGSSLGNLNLAGNTSGSTTLRAAAAATGTLTLPSATDTLVGKATTDVFTNKTFDTAGAGNSFSIAGVAVTANTGTGAVVRATGATLTNAIFTTPSLGVATATSLALNGCTIGSNNFCVAGTSLFGAAVQIASNTPLAAGATGNTNPAFSVSAPVAGTGVNILAAAAGSGATLAAISSGANEDLYVNAKGTGSVRFTSQTMVTVNSATAFSVGQSGVVNAAFQVDAGAASQATGLKVTGAPAGSGVALAAISSGTDEALTFNAKGAGSVTIANVSTGDINLARKTTVASNSALALAVGANGATNPAFVVNASAASVATGVQVNTAAAGGGVGIAAISSGANETIALNAKGTGQIQIGGISTGAVILGAGGGGVTANSLTVNTLFNATGLVKFADLATAALATNANYFTGAANVVVPASVIYQAEVALGSSGTGSFVFNFDTFINAAITMTGNISTQTLSNVKPGKAGQIRFIQDATGGRTMAWNAIFKFVGGVLPTLSTAANAIDVLNYSCVSATYCTAALMNDVK
jgi:hypothetical protein